MKLSDAINNLNHELDARAEQAQKEDDAYAKRQSDEDLQRAIAAEGGERTQTSEQIDTEYQKQMDTAEEEHEQSDEEYYKDHPSFRSELGYVAASSTVIHAAAEALGVTPVPTPEKTPERTSEPTKKSKPKAKKKKMRYDPRNPLTWDPRFRG